MKTPLTPLVMILLCAVTSTARSEAKTGEALELNGQPVLFLDDQFISQSHGVDRVVHQGRKLQEPVLVPREPWEGDRLYTMGTVHYDPQEQVFRLWYMSRSMEGSRPKDRVLYAVSSDGVHWDRPHLGVHEFEGSRDNNIVLQDVHSPSVVVESTATGYDYKLMSMIYASPRGYATATSSDGWHWQWTQPRPAIKGSDNVTMMQDPATGRYLAFNRQRRRVGEHNRRSIFLSVSDDFASWSKPRPVLVPDERDDAAWVTDAARQRTEFYNMTAASYGAQYLGFLTVGRFAPTPQITTANQSGTDGPIHVELTYSHDGSDWHRLESREPILTPGPAAWDQGMILALSNPIVHHDEVWIYYTGFNVTHGGPRPPKRSVIGRAAWPRDRFVSLRARSQQDGVIETALLEPRGTQLIVNADAKGGSLAVELLDESGNVIPGYGREDCIALTTDALAAPVTWRGRNELPPGQAVHVRFILRDAELFSLCTNDEAGEHTHSGHSAAFIDSLTPGRRDITIPTLDISDRRDRHVFIAKGTPKTRQGHATTLLLPDGKTMFVAWTYGHGGKCGPLKRSDDGGKTWSDLLAVPANWKQHANCPALYRLPGPDGNERLFVFANRGPSGNIMYQATSDDDGKTWSPFTPSRSSRGDGPLGEGETPAATVMPFTAVVPVDDGRELLGVTNLRRPGEGGRTNIIAMSRSKDGGDSWSDWQIVLDLGEPFRPCEPELIRSPDGKQLLMLIRENRRSFNAWMMLSDDEGRTWSQPRQASAAVSMDRHQHVYAKDGRLVIVGRDTAAKSPTKNQFVAWVGTYDDLVAGREGQYRIKLLPHHGKGAVEYPSIERLPDGTLVAANCVCYAPGENYSLVATRFTLAELDAIARRH